MSHAMILRRIGLRPAVLVLALALAAAGASAQPAPPPGPPAPGDPAAAPNAATQRFLAIQRFRLNQLRHNIEALDDALDAGDTVAAARLTAAIKDDWAHVGPRVKEFLEQKHPGTAQKIADALADGDYFLKNRAAAAHTGAGVTASKNVQITNAEGKTTDYQATRDTTVHGDTVSTTGQRTNETTGKTVGTYQGSTTRDGTTLTHQDTVTNGAGQVVRSDDTTVTKTPDGFTRDTTVKTANGDTVQTDKSVTTIGGVSTVDRSTTVTGPNGQVDKSVNVTGTVTRTGDSIDATKNIQVTNAAGKTTDYQATRDTTVTGNTVSTTAQLTNETTGKTVGTYQGSTTRDGNTLTHQDTVTNGAGQTVRTDQGTTVRQGDTLTHNGTTSRANGAQTTRTGTETFHPGAGPQRRYGSEWDIVGDRRARFGGGERIHPGHAEGGARP
jgi:hypothetical protein